MKFPKTNQYDQTFLRENMMGSNAMKLLEELAQQFRFEPGMRVLDLGCGRGANLYLCKGVWCTGACDRSMGACH